MKRATITFPKDLADALDAYRSDQEVEQPLTNVVQAALRLFLEKHGYLPTTPVEQFALTPVAHGSGHSDTSINHDETLVRAWQSNRD